MSPTREPWERRALFVILIIGAVLRCIDINDPWHWGASPDPEGAGFKNVFGATATGLLVRNFHEDGFSDSGWMPYYYRLPFRDGGSAELWYTHHPTGWTVLCTALFDLFGPHEWTLRLPSALCSILSIFLVWRLLREVVTKEVALLAAAVVAVVPLSAHYGNQAWNDPARICVNLLLVHRYLRWLRTDDTRHLWFGSLYAFLGGLLDWAAHFVLVGVAIHVAARSFAQRSWRPLLKSTILPIGSFVAIALHYAHMKLAVPPEFASSDTRDTLESIFTPAHGFASWFWSQFSHLYHLLTPVGCALLGIGLLSEIRRVRAGEGSWERSIAYIPAAGLLNVLVFPGRSWNHDFFHHMAIAWYGLMIAVGMSTVADVAARALSRRVAISVTCALLVINAITFDVQMWLRFRGDELVETASDEVFEDLLGDRRHVILTDSNRMAMFSFYSKARLVYVKHVGQTKAIEAGQLHKDPTIEVYFVADSKSRNLPPEWHAQLASAPAIEHKGFRIIRLSGM